MFFRLPVVRFFNRVINRATVTVALVLLQICWLLWAFFSLTAGKVWVNAGLNVLSLFITLYLVRKDENSDYRRPRPAAGPDRRPRPRQQGTEPVCFGVRAVPRMEKLHRKILPLR